MGVVFAEMKSTFQSWYLRSVNTKIVVAVFPLGAECAFSCCAFALRQIVNTVIYKICLSIFWHQRHSASRCLVEAGAPLWFFCWRCTSAWAQLSIKLSIKLRSMLLYCCAWCCNLVMWCIWFRNKVRVSVLMENSLLVSQQAVDAICCPYWVFPLSSLLSSPPLLSFPPVTHIHAASSHDPLKQSGM